MITTLIQLGVDDRLPVWHENTGLAKTLEVAQWLFNYCGWPEKDKLYPGLGHIVEVIPWETANIYPESLKIDFKVLGGQLRLN